jgi:hypothetical protein
MKRFFRFSLLLALCGLFASLLPAQSAYHGGEGDGYDRASLSQVQVSVETEALAGLQLTPQPLHRGEALQLSWSQPATQPLGLQLYDPQGRLVAQATIDAGQSSWQWDLPSLSAGVYLLVLPGSAAQKLLIEP